MKILLIVPPNNLEERYGKLASVGTLYPSLGLAAIGAVGLEAGHEVKVIDCEAHGLGYEELYAKISEYHPDLIGMQTYCNTVNRALTIAGHVKEHLGQDIKIVLGGVQVTIAPLQFIRDPHVDFIVCGEGENIFRNLIDVLGSGGRDFHRVNGLLWKDDAGKVVVNPPQAHEPDLDRLPMPARQLFEMSVYRTSAQLRGKKTFHVVTSRGCPNSCRYCSCQKSFGKTYRYYSTRRVIAEIKHLMANYGMDGLHFYDDSFTVNRQRTMELCNAMIAAGIRIPWACFTRVDCVDEELLRKMREAGCYQIFYGVECANQRLLDYVRKGITIESIRKAFKWTREAGIETLGSFIIGLPTETVAEAKATLKLAKDLDADFIHWEFYTPHPGTDLYEDALKKGKLTTTDLNRFTTWNDAPVYVAEGRTAEELVETKRWLYRKFYMRPVYVLKRMRVLANLPFSNVVKLGVAAIRVFLIPEKRVAGT
jgi:radical SAM superfamily enzyme YgiQ (UPF0313 family)